MKLNGAVELRGIYEIVHKGPDGSLKSKTYVDNTVTNTGKAQTVSRLRGASTLPFKYIAIGSGSTAAAATDTTLGTEITSPSLKRISGTSTSATTTVTDDTAQLVHTWSSTATQTVQEVGVFDTATSGGNMISRTTFTAKNLVSGDTLAVTNKIIVS